MAALAGIEVAILAGGLGTRLQSVVSDRPKPMAEVAGRPFLGHLLDQVAEAGAQRVVLCTGHLAGQVESSLGSSYRGMALAYSPEAKALGTGGALGQALHLVQGPSVLVLNGDSFLDVDLAALVAAHQAKGAEATLSLAQVPDVAAYGQLARDAESRVLAFHEKGSASGPGWVNGGVYLLNRVLLAWIPVGRAVSLEREVLPWWLSRRSVFGHEAPGRFLDIGTPERYAQAQSFFQPEA